MSKHWGKVLGGLVGLIFALLVYTMGFWWAVFVFFCVALGIIIGWRLDLSGGLKKLLERLFSSGGKY